MTTGHRLQCFKTQMVHLLYTPLPFNPFEKSHIYKTPVSTILIAALFAMAKNMEAMEMSIYRELDKQNMVYTYNGLLFNF